MIEKIRIQNGIMAFFVHFYECIGHWHGAYEANKNAKNAQKCVKWKPWLGALLGPFSSPCGASSWSPWGFHRAPIIWFHLPFPFPLFLFPDSLGIHLGPLPRPPKSPLWSSFPSFLRVLFRSLPGSLSRLPSVFFGAPRGLLWGPNSLIPSSSHSSFPFPGAPWLPLGPLPGPSGTPFGDFFQSFHRAPFWSVPRPSCCRSDSRSGRPSGW
jgi:hypothetical protein